jgi:hypothetical protein
MAYRVSHAPNDQCPSQSRTGETKTLPGLDNHSSLLNVSRCSLHREYFAPSCIKKCFQLPSCKVNDERYVVRAFLLLMTSPFALAKLVVIGSRRYIQTALQEHGQPARTMSEEQPWPNANISSHSKPMSTKSSFSEPLEALHSNAGTDESGWSPDPTRRRPTDRRREQYFSRLFDPLRFPPDLAHRTLTHNSHSMARQGHNAALSFIGMLLA